MTGPVLSIIIATRTLALLEQVVTSVRQHVNSQPYEIIVVDTGPTEEAYDWAVANGCSAYLLPGGSFAKACNGAAKAALGEFLWPLNDDVILQSDPSKIWLLSSLRATAIQGARLLYPNGLIQHAGVGFDIDGNPYHLWHRAPAEHPEAIRGRFLPAVTFACALVPRGIWRQLGGLDEGFENGYEDIDFCLQARESLLTVYYSAPAVATHLAGQTPGRFDHEQENKQRFFEKWIASGRLSYVTGQWPFSVGG